MAKRFTDTAKWDKGWFRRLSPKMKCAWEYITDRCDHAGVWDLDFETLSFFVGEDVCLEEALTAFGSRACLADDETKLVIPGFVEFQYGHLNPENRVHKSVLQRLEKIGAQKPLRSTSEGAKDKDKETDTDTDKEKKSYQTKGLSFCIEEYQRTLDHFRISRKANSDEFKVLSLGQRFGFEDLKLALIGARRERRTDTFNPADHFTLERVGRHFQKFLNLGARNGKQPAVEPGTRPDGTDPYRLEVPADWDRSKASPEVLELLKRTEAPRTDASVRGDRDRKDGTYGNTGS